MNRQPHWPLTLYYDGDCPLCAREIQLLRQHADAQRLCLVDISLNDFYPESVGLSREALQNRLHARFADGQWPMGHRPGCHAVELARSRSWPLGCATDLAGTAPFAGAGLPTVLPAAPTPKLAAPSGCQPALQERRMRGQQTTAIKH